MRGPRPVVLVWLLLAALTSSLLLRATAWQPKGRVFVGTFYYVDDFYNYLGSVEQAQRGALVFRSKLAPPELPPALVNLEWLLVGWLSALLGGRALLAYRVFGVLALLGLVAVTRRWLSRCGVPAGRQLAALLLVFAGGGVGGALVAAGALARERAFDVRTGAFPFVEAIANPHFVAGTALLAAALGVCAAGRPRTGAALGARHGPGRPYDAVLFVCVESAATLLLQPRVEWGRRLAPLLAVVPVLGYSAWLFLAGPGFAAFSNAAYAALSPSPLELAVALGPAAALALTAWAAWRRASREQRDHLARLALWATLAILVVAVRPLAFSLQLLVGAGLPLLVLAATGLCRLRHGVLEAAVPAMATSAAYVTWLCLALLPAARSVPSERWLVARSLANLCRPGELVIAPADVGLYAGAFSSCWPYVSHPAAPDYAKRLREVEDFYTAASNGEPAAARWLEARCAAHVVLPPGVQPPSLSSAYTSRATLAGGGGALTVWSRRADQPCPARGR